MTFKFSVGIRKHKQIFEKYCGHCSLINLFAFIWIYYFHVFSFHSFVTIFLQKCLNAFDLPGLVAQSVTCLATDASLTADPGVTSSILVRSHTLLEIDHNIISMVILLPSAESFKLGCCQLQAKVCARSTGLMLVQACPGKSVVR